MAMLVSNASPRRPSSSVRATSLNVDHNCLTWASRSFFIHHSASIHPLQRRRIGHWSDRLLPHSTWWIKALADHLKLFNLHRCVHLPGRQHQGDCCIFPRNRLFAGLFDRLHLHSRQLRPRGSTLCWLPSTLRLLQRLSFYCADFDKRTPWLCPTVAAIQSDNHRSLAWRSSRGSCLSQSQVYHLAARAASIHLWTAPRRQSSIRQIRRHRFQFKSEQCRKLLPHHSLLRYVPRISIRAQLRCWCLSADGVPQLPSQQMGFQHSLTEFFELDATSTPSSQDASHTYRCFGDEPSDCNDEYGTLGINLAHIYYSGYMMTGSVGCSGEAI